MVIKYPAPAYIVPFPTHLLLPAFQPPIRATTPCLFSRILYYLSRNCYHNKFDVTLKFQIYIWRLWLLLISSKHTVFIRMQRCRHVTSYKPLYLEKGSFSDHVSNVNLNQRSIIFPTVYDMTIFGYIFLNLPYDVIRRLRPPVWSDVLKIYTKRWSCKFWFQRYIICLVSAAGFRGEE